MATLEGNSRGGYDYSFVEPPPEELLCNICRLPCREAQSSKGHDRVYCKHCVDEIKASASVDRDVEALKVYCPNKKDGCGWTGEIARVNDHLRGCKISCSKCKQIVYFSTMKSHLDTECPCYCPYCDITAEREMISSEHKEKCHNFPLTSPNNIGVDDVPQDKFDKANKINELQNEILDKINQMLNPSILVELQKDISIIKKEATQSFQITKECCDKIDKQNDTTLLNQAYSIRSYLTIAVLIIAILIALLLQLNLLQTRSEEDINKYKQNITELQHQITLFREVLNRQMAEIKETTQDERNEIIRGIDHRTDETKQQLNSLQTRLEEAIYKHNQSFAEIQQLLQKVFNSTITNQHYAQLSSSAWFTKLLLSSELSKQVTPVIVKMSSFTKQVRDNKNWYSSHFFAFEGGYQMRLRVYPAGYGDGEGTHVSVYLHLMKGPHDDKLEQSGHWPLRGTFTIELLNQLNDSDHYIYMLQLHHYRCSKCTERVLEGVEAKSRWGHPQFISHNTLLHHSNNSYHKSDCLIFRISYEDLEAPYQVAPVTFKVAKFSYWLKREQCWNSSPFFAYKGGYQMRLRVYAAGYGDGKGTHVSVYLHLMKGPHDDKLEQLGHWPLKGTFIIELLNQHGDYNHHSRAVHFFYHHRCTECTNRVLKGFEAKSSWGRPQFISHDTLLHHSNHRYYKNDCLIFRISKQ